MAHFVHDTCTNCGSCIDECPVGAISEKDGQAFIDADACTDCGACADVCPVSAITGEE